MAKSSIKELASELNVDAIEVEVACVDVLGVDPDKKTEFSDQEIEALRSHFSRPEPPQLQAAEETKVIEQAEEAEEPAPTQNTNLKLAERHEKRKEQRKERAEKLTKWKDKQALQQKEVVTASSAQKAQLIKDLATKEVKDMAAIADVVSRFGQAAFVTRKAENDADFFDVFSEGQTLLIETGVMALDLKEMMGLSNVQGVSESYQLHRKTTENLETLDFSALAPENFWISEEDSEES